MANVITSTNLDIGEIIVGSNGTNEVASQPASALSIPTQTAPLVVDQVVVGASANTVKPLPAQTQGAVFYADPSGKITSDPSVLQIGAGNNLRLGGRIRQYNGQDITSGQMLIGSTGSHSFQTSTMIGVPGQITITNADGAVYIGLVNPDGGYPNIVYASQFGVRAGGTASTNVSGLQMAISTLSHTTGGRLVIDTPGVVDLDGDVVVDRPLELTCIGPGSFTFMPSDTPLLGTVLRNTRNSGDTLRTSSDYALRVSNCTFTSFPTPVSGSAIHLTTTPVSAAHINRGSSVTGCTFNNVWVGVEVDRADMAWIDKNLFTTAQKANIHIHSSSNDGDVAWVTENRMDSSSSTHPTNGHVFWQSGGQIHIVNNGITNAPFAILYDAQAPIPIPFTGTTHTSAVVTNIPSTTGMEAGWLVAGTGVLGGTFILTVDSATQITLTQATVSSVVGASLTVQNTRNPTNHVFSLNRLEGAAQAEIQFQRTTPVAPFLTIGGVMIQNNEMAVDGSSGIKIQAPVAGPNPYIRNMTITGSQFTSAGGGSVFVNALAPVDANLMVSNNMTDVPTAIGVQVTGNQPGIAVGNNFFSISTTPYAVTATSAFRIIDPIGTTLSNLTTNMPGAGEGSQVYCTNCKGVQNAGYAVGTCDTTGPATGTTATMQAGAWRC